MRVGKAKGARLLMERTWRIKQPTVNEFSQ